jgi:hypothetical protein
MERKAIEGKLSYNKLSLLFKKLFLLGSYIMLTQVEHFSDKEKPSVEFTLQKSF